MRSASAAALLLAAVVTAGCSGGASTSSPSGSASPVGTLTQSSPATPSSPGVASPSASTSAALAAFYDQKLRWRSCGGRLRCATLKVPRSYAAPDLADAVELSLIRNPARDRAKRIGNLVVNPGGPGGSGYDYARASDAVITSAIRDRYDVVGFDPRGVQRSRPAIDCISDGQLDAYIRADTNVASAAEQLRDSRRFAAGCAKRSPSLVGEVGTRDAARDLDVLRAALGERKLDYLGKSYGTLLGITYAETFPGRTGRMVLDGVLDPSLDAESLLRGQSAGFERAYRAFLRYCVRSGCPLGSSTDAAYARTRSWLDGLEQEPLRRGGGRALTRPLAQLALLGSLYEDRSQWASLRDAFVSALGGSPYPMLALADSAVDRQPGGRFPNNANEAQYAVTCLDRAYPATVADTAARAARYAKADPVFGEYIAWGDLPCTQWKVPPTRQAHSVAGKGVPPILVLGTTRDPATPYSWSTSLVRQLGNAGLVTWKGDGHTAYNRGSACVDAAVHTYLLRGDLPATDPRCSGR